MLDKNKLIKHLRKLFQVDGRFDSISFENFFNVYRYLCSYPENLSNIRRASFSFEKQDDVALLADKYSKDYYSIDLPNEPNTKADEVVSIVLELMHNYGNDKLENIKLEHRQSMAAENIIGKLLERYIATNLIPLGWYWCCGSFVKSIDFIFPQGGQWKLLQIKNRSNTENSSSSAIRRGTEITKWYRMNATNGQTKWETFPYNKLPISLSEENFIDFVKTYISTNL